MSVFYVSNGGHMYCKVHRAIAYGPPTVVELGKYIESWILNLESWILEHGSIAPGRGKFSKEIFLDKKNMELEL